MTAISATAGALCTAAALSLWSYWYGQPWLARQIVLNKMKNIRLDPQFPTEHHHTSRTDHLVNLAQFLDSTARNMRLGKSLLSSLGSTIETGKYQGRLVAGIGQSVVRGDSLFHLTDTSTKDSYSSAEILILRTLELAANGGLGAILALENSASVLRNRASDIHDRQVQATQALLSARVLSWVPALLTTWLLATNSDVRKFMLTSRAGWMCLITGIGTNMIGHRWMRRLVSSA